MCLLFHEQKGIEYQLRAFAGPEKRGETIWRKPERAQAVQSI